MKVNTGSGMKPNSFRAIPELHSLRRNDFHRQVVALDNSRQPFAHAERVRRRDRLSYRPRPRQERDPFPNAAVRLGRRPRENIFVLGPTGVGKSFVACALAQKACRDGYAAL